MAAVAGSKGRLHLEQAHRPSFQMQVVERLINGSWSASDAASALIKKAALREVGVDTNMICNLKCQYCYLDDRPEAKGTVPLDLLGARLRLLAETGTALIAFIGKEPLSDGRAIELLGALNSLRQSGVAIRTGMVTNGTLVRRWLGELVDANLSYLDISIDGLGDVDNQLRGSAVADRIRDGVTAIVGSPLRDRFATATVLTAVSVKRYPQFVEEMLGSGVPTCFASPVLRFAMSNEVADFAVTLEDTWRLAELLARQHGAGDGRQIILDLPYRYTWNLLRSGRVPYGQVLEDSNEALFWQFPASAVYLKLNPFPYSYWRALRITHDGRSILNMDLAAHAEYAHNSLAYESVDANVFAAVAATGQQILSEFITRHAHQTISGPEFERDLAQQFERHRQTRAAA